MTRSISRTKALWIAKAMYFTSCFSIASILNFVSLFFQEKGFSKAEIGVLLSLPAITIIGGAPFWGTIADKTHNSRGVVTFTFISGVAALIGMTYVESFWTMIAVGFVGFFQLAPIPPLVDQIVLQLLEEVGGEYGRQRMFGGIGWGVGSYLTGELVALYNVNWAFYVLAISAGVSLVVLYTLPQAAPVKSEEASMMAGFRQLRQKVDILCLFLLVLYIGLFFGVISSFLTLYLYNLGDGDARIVGIAIACEAASEMPAFFFADKVIEKIGSTGVILAAIIGYSMRLTCYALITNPYYALPFQCLHGITFSLLWAASTNYVFRASNPGTHGTMMGLLQAMLQGYGKTFGTLLGGWLYDSYGAVTMWWVLDAATPVALIGLYIFYRVSKSVDHPVLPETESKISVQVLISPLG